MKYLITLSLVFSATSVSADTLAKYNKSKAIMKQAAIVRAIGEAAEKVGIPKEPLIAICWVESNHRNVGAVADGNSDSIGICQVKLETAQHMDTVYKHVHKATVARLMDPYINAFYAAKYLKFQLDRYDGDIKKAIDAYNKGTAVSSNSKYVRKVMKHIARNP